MPGAKLDRHRALWFLAMNLVAIACAALVFAIFFFAEALDPMFATLVRRVFAYDVVAVAIASSPLFAALLVGIARSRVRFGTRP